MHIPKQTILWERFRDNTFLLWTHEYDELVTIITHLNTLHPYITFTSEICDKEVIFLDLLIFLKQGHLFTMLYTEQADRHIHLTMILSFHQS